MNVISLSDSKSIFVNLRVLNRHITGMYKKEILFILILSSFLGFAQKNGLNDSLQGKSSVEKVNFLLKKSKEEPVSELLLNKALKIAHKEKQDSTKGKMFISLARYFYSVRKDTVSKNYLKKAEKLLKNNNEKLYLNSLIGLSKLYALLDKSDSSFYYKKKSLQKSIELKDSLQIAKCYYNLGHSYYYNAEGVNYTEAQKYFGKALAYYTKLNIEDVDYYRMYAVTLKNRKEAEKYFLKAEKQLKNQKEKFTRFYISKGNYYFGKQLFTESFNAFKKANDEAVKTNNRELIPTYIGMGGSKLYLKQYKETITYLTPVLKNINKINYRNKITLLDDLATAYEKTNDYKKALQLTQQKMHLKDSVADIENEKKLLEFNVKFKSAEKDRQITEQKLKIVQQEYRQIYWIIGSLIVLSIIVLVYQNFTHKQEIKKRKAENELLKIKEIEDERTVFLGNISHEIRTPLTLILGNIQMALEENIKNEKVTNYLNTALNNSKKVIEDSNHILDLLKFEKHKQEVKKSSVNIHSFCKRIFFSFESLATSKKIKLNYFSDISDDIFVESDENKLEKIITNFISNAIKYSDANSKINFFLILKNNYIHIEVQDYGLGIPETEKTKIFERFYQAENSKKVGGIGIGLALSKDLAELLGGHINVKSELGKGSSFTLEIPFNQVFDTEKSNNTQRYSLQEKENKVVANKPNILIVEDNIEMGTFLKEILSENYNCTIAFNGEEALEKIKTTSFDLITSDIMMPKIDGFEFRKNLNKNSQYKNIPFIFISAKNLEEDVIKGFSLGSQDYIVKPFNKNELLARIKNLITNKKTREIWTLKNKEVLTEEKESFDKELIEKAKEIVVKNMSNEDFKVADLASEVGYSQRQFTRLLKEFTGLSPVKFILEIRLQKAYWLLENKIYPTLNEVKYEVGITSTTYFNKKFKERFGVLHNEIS